MEKIKDQKKIEAYVKKHWKYTISTYKTAYVRKTDLKPVEYTVYRSQRNHHTYAAKTLPELQFKLYNLLQEEQGGKTIQMPKEPKKYIGCDGANLETMKAYIAKNHHRKIGRVKDRDSYTYETTCCGAMVNGKTAIFHVKCKNKNGLIQKLYDHYQKGEAVNIEVRRGRPCKGSSKKDLSLAKDFSEIPELKIIPEEADVPASSEGNNISLTINKNGQSIIVTGNNFGEIKNLLNNIASALALMEENK